MTVRLRAGLLAVLLVVSGCSDDSDEPAAPSTTRTTAESVPAGQGIRLAVPSEPASLNPFDPRSRTPAGSALLGVILPALFRVAPDGQVTGYLVDDGTVSEADDRTSASFSLRDGVRWSDGRPITAEDLRFTLEAVRGTAWPGPVAGYDRVSALDGTGADVTLRFDGPFPGWRRLFSGEDFVLPAHRLAGQDLAGEWAAGPDLAGGPFRLGPVTPGLEVRLLANEEWWGPGPSAGVIQVLVVPDVRTMEQLLAAGELDLAWPAPSSNRIGRFSDLDGVDMSVAGPGGWIALLVANTEELPATERRGFLALPDRDRFAAVLLEDEVALARGLAGPEGGSTWAEVTPEAAPPGLDDAFTATLVSAEEDAMAGLLGRLLERRVRELGGDLELKSTDSPRLDGAWLRDGAFHVAVTDDVTWPDPCWSCWFGASSVGRTNTSRITGTDDLAAAADRGEAAAAAALEAQLREQGVLLPLWRPRAVLAARGVTGAEANSWSIGPFWKIEAWAFTSG